MSATIPPCAVISPTRICLPSEVDWHRWCVIAADQFTSSLEYWQRVKQVVGDHPSTLNLIVPEVFLTVEDAAALSARVEKVHATMRDYRERVLIQTPPGVIYVERVTGQGRLRRSVVAALDLQTYSFDSQTAVSSGGGAQVRASEATILERIPAREAVRRGADLETPHVQVLFDDPGGQVFTSLADSGDLGEPLYDTELMADGGHLKGWFISADDPRWSQLCSRLETLDDARGFRFLVGDGNHSLAAAKSHWQRLTAQGAPPEHPARWALVELLNIHDPGIAFEPIHRVLKGADWERVSRAITAWNDRHTLCQRTTLTCLTEWGQCDVELAHPGPLVVEALDEIIAGVLNELCLNAATAVDYIHGREELQRVVLAESAVAWVIPPLQRSTLFDYVGEVGPMPKKSFSLGHAEDKRYYCECRLIRP